ncbi:MAG: hydroxymethylbilane synthase [Planctomycetota bacterium]|nr:hydroxymethylbilane synthase [Planctomycetota bacterium]
MKIRLGTRASNLARTQSGWVAAQIQGMHPEISVEEVLIETGGDQDQVTPLHQVGAPGVFTAEVERALASGQVDLAVHSLKDLPIVQPPELMIAAIPAREDPRDAWISARYPGLVDVPPGSTVATGSLRRSSQILHRFPQLVVEGIRGNVETRLRVYEERGDAGLVLACAGLHRLALKDRIRCAISITEVTPAPAQGALAVEIRTEDRALAKAIEFLDDPITRTCVEAERQFLAALGGGCHLPVGAFAVVSGDHLSLCGVLGLPDGSRLVRLGLEGSAGSAGELGHQLAQLVRKAGGDEILQLLDEQLGLE